MPGTRDAGDQFNAETSVDSLSSADTILDSWNAPILKHKAPKEPWNVVGRLLDHFARMGTLGIAVAAWAHVAEDARKRRRDALFDAMSSQVRAAKRCCRGLEASAFWASGRRAEETSLMIAWRALLAWRDGIRKGNINALLVSDGPVVQADSKSKFQRKSSDGPAKPVVRRGSIAKSSSMGALNGPAQPKRRPEQLQPSQPLAKKGVRLQRQQLEPVPELPSRVSGSYQSGASMPSSAPKSSAKAAAPKCSAKAAAAATPVVRCSAASESSAPSMEDLLSRELPSQSPPLLGVLSADDGYDVCQGERPCLAPDIENDHDTSFDTWPLCNSHPQGEELITPPRQNRELIDNTFVSIIDLVDDSVFDVKDELQSREPVIRGLDGGCVDRCKPEVGDVPVPSRELAEEAPCPSAEPNVQHDILDILPVDAMRFDPPSRSAASSNSGSPVDPCVVDSGIKAVGHPPVAPNSRTSTPCRAERSDADTRLARGPERFFYDTASYTGCARYGGPLAVDKCAESPKAGPGVWADALRGASCRSSSQTREERAGTPRRNTRTTVAVAAAPPPQISVRRRASMPVIPTPTS